jgi:excisionase family DNA binding protein
MPHDINEPVQGGSRGTTPVVEKLLRVEDVARDVLRIGRTRVYQMIASGELRSVAVGRSRRIPESALQDYIDKLKAEDGVSDAR